jgi:predicted ATPase
MLDGVPLAIELAAQRLRTVSLDVLLQSNLIRHVLEQAVAAELPHQRTLIESIRWSYDLLGREHRKLLHQLATFQGTFTPEDIDNASSELEPVRQDWSMLLPGLIDASLIQVYRGSRYSYRLLHYVREFLRSYTMQ